MIVLEIPFTLHKEFYAHFTDFPWILVLPVCVPGGGSVLKGNPCFCQHTRSINLEVVLDNKKLLTTNMKVHIKNHKKTIFHV